MMLTFIKHKVDVNIRGYNQFTPLMKAAASGYLSCIQLLLTHEADPDLQNEYGETALMKAARNIFPEIVGELLSHGADDQMKVEVLTGHRVKTEFLSSDFEFLPRINDVFMLKS